MSYLENLIGKNLLQYNQDISHTYPLNQKADILSDVIKSEIYVQLVFEGYSLSIYNPIQLKGTHSFEDLIGKKIICVIEGNDQVALIMDDGIEVNVDLREECYNGPEAMVLYGPDNLCVVWN